MVLSLRGIHRATLETCSNATGTVVAIDVIRAFTTAAFAFAAGARDIIPVSTVEEAFALRERFPGSLAMGEVGGLPPEGFDFGNSPAALIGLDLGGRRLIQRTGAGTQGIVRSVRAETILAASFVCAGATVRYIKSQLPTSVTLVSTGRPPQGDEDDACADYIEALLRNETPDVEALLSRVRDSVSDDIFAEAAFAGFADDLHCCLDLDRFDFAMLVRRREGLLVMEAVSEDGIAL
jgi:2-phosphosulfolactate phosphatase